MDAADGVEIDGTERGGAVGGTPATPNMLTLVAVDTILSKNEQNTTDRRRRASMNAHGHAFEVAALESCYRRPTHHRRNIVS